MGLSVGIVPFFVPMEEVLTKTRKEGGKIHMQRKSKQQMPGQISIFDYLREIQATIELQQQVLCKGQTVFLVDKGTIVKYEVYGIYNVEDIETVVLIATDATAALYKHLPLTELGNSLFESQKKAEEKLLEHLDQCNCIMASDMNVKDFKAFTTVHKKGSILTAFYAILDNGYVYVKDYFSCGHLMQITPKRAEELLQEQISSYPYKATPLSELPRLANMYKTTNPASEDWEYAEIGSPFTNVG